MVSLNETQVLAVGLVESLQMGANRVIGVAVKRPKKRNKSGGNPLVSLFRAFMLRPFGDKPAMPQRFAAAPFSLGEVALTSHLGALRCHVHTLGLALPE